MPFVSLGIPSHDVLPGVSSDDHHVGDHTVASHTDTTGTGAELDELTNASAEVVLHTHPDNPGSASQTAVEAESSSGSYVSGVTVRFSPGVAKAWCRITAAGGLESPSYNVASVTDTSTGVRTIVVDDDFSTDVFACVSAQNLADLLVIQKFAVFAVGSVRLTVLDTSDMVQDESTGQAMWGDQ